MIRACPRGRRRARRRQIDEELAAALRADRRRHRPDPDQGRAEPARPRTSAALRLPLVEASGGRRSRRSAPASSACGCSSRPRQPRAPARRELRTRPPRSSSATVGRAASASPIASSDESSAAATWRWSSAGASAGRRTRSARCSRAEAAAPRTRLAAELRRCARSGARRATPPRGPASSSARARCGPSPRASSIVPPRPSSCHETSASQSLRVVRTRAPALEPGEDHVLASSESRALREGAAQAGSTAAAPRPGATRPVARCRAPERRRASGWSEPDPDERCDRGRARRDQLRPLLEGRAAPAASALRYGAEAPRDLLPPSGRQRRERVHRLAARAMNAFATAGWNCVPMLRSISAQRLFRAQAGPVRAGRWSSRRSCRRRPESARPAAGRPPGSRSSRARRSARGGYSTRPRLGGRELEAAQQASREPRRPPDRRPTGPASACRPWLRTAASTATLPRSCRRAAQRRRSMSEYGEPERARERVRRSRRRGSSGGRCRGRARRRCSRRSRARGGSPGASAGRARAPG